MKTVGGIIAGAVGAHELERGYEKRRERKRAEEGDPYARGDGGDRQHGRRRRSSGGGLFDGVREKVEGLLSPGGDEREKEREGKRRARSHVEERRRRRSGEGYSSDEEDYERYERRRSGGGRKGRDDYY